jgi:hypothetical protein
MGGACGMHGGRTDMHMRCWWGDLQERDHLKDLGVDGEILKQILKKHDGRAQTVFIPFRRVAFVTP